MSQGKERPVGQTPRVETDVSAHQVLDYLRAHPDFFRQHPDILNEILPPRREMGPGVKDFQSALIDRLRGDLDAMKGQSQHLIDTSRVNLSTQACVHECILALIAARSFEELIQCATTDLAVILDLDVVTLCIEADGGAAAPAGLQGLHLVANGTVASLIPHTQSCILRSDISGDPDLFGGAAPLVRSDALIRLNVSHATPSALLALGSRTPDKFNPGQATELLTFLARVLENLIRAWLDLPE